MAQKPFPRWSARIRAHIQRALVQGGLWRWALAVGFAVALGGGVWAYDVLVPQIRASWPRWKAEGLPWVREALQWIEFLVSITLTLTILCWATAILFCLLGMAVFTLLHLLDRFLARGRHTGRVRRAECIVGVLLRKEWVVGTILNVLASTVSLAVLTILLDRQLDYWDLGIQIAVSAAVELIVLQVLFAGGRLDWPARIARHGSSGDAGHRRL